MSVVVVSVAGPGEFVRLLLVPLPGPHQRRTSADCPTPPRAARGAHRHRARLCLVRLGVLDVGSNTVNLLVVDARRGGHPTPMSSTKATLRLAESIDNSGKITRKGADKLIETIEEFEKIADSSGCAELMAFATSAVRDAKNSEDVLSRVRKETGVELQVLQGVDESR